MKISLADHNTPYYLSGKIHCSILQINDSQPYGNNIAVDPDFPSAFSVDNAAVGVVGLGYRFDDRFRIEGSLAFRKNDFNSSQTGTGARAGQEYILNGSARSASLTVEGFYDFKTNSAFKPYIKAGISVSHNKYNARLGGSGVAAFDAFDGTADGYYDAYSDGSSTEFVWNIGFGASYQIDDAMSLFGEYQYVSTGDMQTDQDAFTDGFSLDSAAHEVLFGLRAKF